jgi:hypothetical protein
MNVFGFLSRNFLDQDVKQIIIKISFLIENHVDELPIFLEFPNEDQISPSTSADPKSRAAQFRVKSC